ncbi:MAG: hypothetical protein LBQ67_01375 [Treponema sp.]|jgi:hypothetical protein|nr:hypothetical protein [Treponema sp.]
MKRFFLVFLLCFLLLLTACPSPPIARYYRLRLPSLPAGWEEILGEPLWRLEWVNGDGREEVYEGPGRELPELSLMQEWSSPVLAWPYWPEKKLFPGDMKPAGGIFPWDVSGGRLVLDWRAGVDAFFWRELSAAASGGNRLPWYFDWPRFRELLRSDVINEDVRLDPWRADWKTIAGKTLASGFDRRRIVPRPVAEITIPGMGGFWIGSSPFSPPLDFPPGGSLSLPAAEAVETWVSSEGILRCGGSTWLFSP